MDQAGAFGGIAHVFQNRDQLVQIVPVDRADIIEAQLFEQRAAHHHAAREFVGFAHGGVDGGGQLAREALGDLAQFEEGARGHQPRQIGRKPAHRRRDRHVIVVEDHHQPVAGLFGVVHRLIGHARAHRAIADHRDALAGLARKLVGDGKAQRRRDGGGTVRRAERIVFAFAALGEARKAAALAQGAHRFAPAGEDLVG
jgi:hypothetical protein